MAPMRKKILEFFFDDDDFEYLNSQRRRQQQRFSFVLRAVEAAITDRRVPNERRIRGIEDYVLKIVPRYPDQQFKEHFRMCRSTFELLTRISTYTQTLATDGIYPAWRMVDLQVLVKITQERIVTQRTSRIPIATKILMTLWLLGNQESFRGVADRFGVNKGVLFYVANQMIGTWADAAPVFIQWPTDFQAVSLEFARKWHFPGVVGAVDGCHIAIKAPEEEQDAYYNRSEFHSIILQGCCDSRMVFTHVHAGSPGRMHDARVFNNSGLDEIVDALPPTLHVLGDSAYPLRVGLMRPYKNNGHLTKEQVTFNKTLGAARSVIERAFAQLKGKFRRLKYLDMEATVMMNKYVVACCVLHNIILEAKEPFVMEDDVELGDNDDDSSLDGQMQAADSRALEKQKEIAQLLYTQ